MKAKTTIGLLACLFVVTAYADEAYDTYKSLRDKVLNYRDKRVEECISKSPLASAAKQCKKESRVPQIQDEARNSDANCQHYYRKGTQEQADCRIKVYQDALDSMDNNTPYHGWQAPDGSSKPSKKNSFSHL